MIAANLGLKAPLTLTRLVPHGVRTWMSNVRLQVPEQTSMFNADLGTESGNMLIMLYAHARFSGDGSLIQRHVRGLESSLLTK